MRHRAIACCLAMTTALLAQAHGQQPGSLRPCPSPPDLRAGDCLGTAVAVASDEVLASARGRDTPVNRAGGIARWVRAGQAWAFDRWIDPPRPAAGQEFGHSISLRGGTLAVGAPADDLHGTDAGAAWVLTKADGDAWSPGAELSPSVPEAGERFGSVIATDGTVVAVAAPYATTDGLRHAGRVLVFEPTTGACSATAELVAPGPRAESFFGESLACADGCLLVGCPSDDTVEGDAGAVFSYRRTSSGWLPEQRIEAPAPTAGARFGQSVAIDGTRLWIAEPRAASGGRVHLYERVGGRFERVGSIQLAPQAGTPEFGWSIACAGSSVLSGAPRATNGEAESGIVLLGESATWPVEHPVLLGPASGADLELAGISVAMSGSTLAFGAPGREQTGFASGAVFAADLGFDCNLDGIPDALAIAAGTLDQNADGVPDECQCTGDLDGNSLVDTADISLLLLDFGSTGWPLPTDLDGTGVVDTADLSLLLMMFGECG